MLGTSPFPDRTTSASPGVVLTLSELQGRVGPQPLRHPVLDATVHVRCLDHASAAQAERHHDEDRGDGHRGHEIGDGPAAFEDLSCRREADQHEDQRGGEDDGHEVGGEEQERPAGRVEPPRLERHPDHAEGGHERNRDRHPGERLRDPLVDGRIGAGGTGREGHRHVEERRRRPREHLGVRVQRDQRRDPRGENPGQADRPGAPRRSPRPATSPPAAASRRPDPPHSP